jgi:hypothetical protein
MWQQGDVLIEQVQELPFGLKKLSHLILASSDSTAQRHRIKERKVAELFSAERGDQYLIVTAAEATVVHPEHKPITLAAGMYRVWKQREFAAAKPRPVMD